MTQAISMEKVYHKLKKIEKSMATKEQIDSLLETVEIISNPETMEQINGSLQDIKLGRVKEISSVNDLLRESINA